MKEFPMLNTFRFCAAMGVVIQHSEELKHFSGWMNGYPYSSIRIIGGISVTAFFVLSGFLISYILINEKIKLNGIQLSHFYKKRILRIWPLYFLTIILYKCILPFIPIESSSYIHTNSDFSFGQLQPLLEVNIQLEWIFLLLLLPHVLLSLGKVFYPLHIWSIGVEETFYLFWPWVVKKSRNFWKTFLYIIITYLFLYSISFIIWIYLLKTGSEHAKYLQSTTFFLYCQRISCMAIGALGADILIFNREKILHWARHPLTAIITPIIIVFGLYKGFYFPVLLTEIYCVLFILFILQIIHWGENVKKFLPYQISENLGKISYGIYMYHPFCIILTLEIMKQTSLKVNSTNSYVIFYMLICLLTFLMSHISFKYVEQPILMLKKKWIRVENPHELTSNQNSLP